MSKSTITGILLAVIVLLLLTAVVNKDDYSGEKKLQHENFSSYIKDWDGSETNSYFPPKEIPKKLRAHGDFLGYDKFFIEQEKQGAVINIKFINFNKNNPAFEDFVLFNGMSIVVNAESAISPGNFENHTIVIMKEPFAVHSQSLCNLEIDVTKELKHNGYTDNYEIVNIIIN